MATDAWQRTREGFTILWQRIQPQRAEIIAAELESSREEVLRALTADDQEILSELRSQWQGALRRLLITQPGAVDELRELLDELSPDDAADVLPGRHTARHCVRKRAHLPSRPGPAPDGAMRGQMGRPRRRRWPRLPVVR